MNKILLCFFILIPGLAFAEGEHHGAAHMDEHAIKALVFQAINVGILIAAMVYFLKDTVREAFKNKRSSYLIAAERSQKARKQAEQEHLEMKTQLTKLESTTDESLSRARAEAADLKNQMLVDAQLMSKRIRDDAEAFARVEVEKARQNLRHEMIQQSTKLAEQQIREKVSGEDHQRLQSDFIQNIGAVQS